jgi:hypothetical protein
MKPYIDTRFRFGWKLVAAAGLFPAIPTTLGLTGLALARRRMA